MSKSFKIFSFAGLLLSVFGMFFGIGSVRSVVMSTVEKVFNRPIDIALWHHTLFLCSQSVFVALTVLFALFLTYKYWKKWFSFISFENQKFIKYTTQIPILLIGFIFILYILKNLFLVCKIEGYNILVFCLTTVLHTVFCFFIFRKENKKTFTISLIISYLIIVFSSVLSLFVYDFSWDGQTYHQGAVIALDNGWNPFYEYIEIYDGTWLWVNHYAKFTWIIGSVFSSVFGNIEAGKAFYIIFFAAFFLLSLKFVSQYQKKSIYILIISVLLAASPVVLVQMFTYYNDGVVALLVFILLLYLIEFDNKSNKYLSLFAVLAISVFLINIKFSGFVCGIIILAYLIKKLVQKEFSDALKLTVIGIFILIIGVGFVGFNPYIINYTQFGHPFFPLYGENPVDIIDFIIPEYLKSQNSFVRFFNNFGNFAELRNFIPFNPLKIAKIDTMLFTDPRISGFGLYFFEIMLLSLFIMLFSIKNNRKEYKPILFAVSVLFLISMIFPERWWARYISYFWFIPILLLVPANLDKFKKIPIIILVIIFCVNNSIFFWADFAQGIEYRKVVKKMEKDIDKIESNSATIVLTMEVFKYSADEKFKNVSKNIDYSIEHQSNMNRGVNYLIGWYENENTDTIQPKTLTKWVQWQ